MVHLEFQVYNIHVASARVFLLGRIHPRAWTTGTWECLERETPTSKLYIFGFLWLINQRPPNVPPAPRNTGLIFGLIKGNHWLTSHTSWFSRIYFLVDSTQSCAIWISKIGWRRCKVGSQPVFGVPEILVAKFWGWFILFLVLATMPASWKSAVIFVANPKLLGGFKFPKPFEKICASPSNWIISLNLEVRTSCRAWVSTLEDDAFSQGFSCGATWSCAPFFMIHK